MVSDQYLCDRIDTFVAVSLRDVLQMTPNYKVTLVVKDLQPDNFSKISECKMEGCFCYAADIAWFTFCNVVAFFSKTSVVVKLVNIKKKLPD